jgi:hypothetical protein
MPRDRGQSRLFGADRWPAGRHRTAYDRMIAARRRAGSLEEVDQSLVALGRSAADLCDELAGIDEARWHFIAALKVAADIDARLRTVGGPEHDAFAELLAQASGSAPSGDAD